MPLSSGDKLGPYEILAPLGAGGMGEVYKARDTRLGRVVAIKTSKTEFSERFAREARTVAALNHPNICQLYDLGTLPGGGGYLVIEFIDGAPIAPVDSPRKLLDLAVQIADGIAAAHAAGVTHRDLKPDNIFITGPQTPHPGRVKILDFGLAKHASSLPPSEATQTIAITRPGTVMGTVAYMSPEQARGEETDARSDQFSFGLIMYEMAAGRRAFARPSAAETMAAIIRDEAEPLPPSVPAPLRWVVERCLSKDPAERYDSTRDLYRELKHARERLSESSVSGPQAAQPAMPRPRWQGIAAIAALATVCAAGAAFFFLRSPRSAPPSFQPLTFRREIIGNGRFAPDGKTVVYDSTEDGVRYHIYSLQPGNPERRDLGIEAKLLDVSGAGQMALLNAAGELQSAPVTGGAPRTVAEGVALAAWSPDGRELAIIHTIDGRDLLEYPPGKVLYESPGYISDPRVSRDGRAIYLVDHPLKGDGAGFVRRIDRAGKTTILSPHYSLLEGLSVPKDGDDVLYTAAVEGSQSSMYLAGGEGHVRALASFSELNQLLAVNAVGEVLLSRRSARALMFLSESPSSSARDLSWHDASLPGEFSADNKSLLFLEGGSATGADWDVYLRGTDGSPAIRLGIGARTSLSSDGRWVLVTKNQSPAQLSLLPTGAGEARQVTSDSLNHEDAAFLPDGQSMVFVGNAPGRPRMWYAQDLKGGQPRAFGPEGVSFAHLDDSVVLSPDGRNIAVVTPDKNVLLQPIAGGAGRAVTGVKAGFTPVRWCPGGATIMLQKKEGMAMQIFETNVTTGAQRLWKSITPPEGLAVADVRQVRIAPDCRSLAWGVWVQESRLFLMKGLGF